MQGDGGKRSEGRVFIGDRVGDGRRESRVGRDHFGVRRISDHAVASGETHDTARIEDLTDVAIPERNRLGELTADSAYGRENPFAPSLGEDRTEFLWLLASLTEPPATTELHQHPFGTEGDQRVRRAHEQTTAPRTRGGDGEELGATRAQILDKLAQDQERSRSRSDEDCSVRQSMAAVMKAAANINGVNQKSRSIEAWAASSRRTSPSGTVSG